MFKSINDLNFKLKFQVSIIYNKLSAWSYACNNDFCVKTLLFCATDLGQGRTNIEVTVKAILHFTAHAKQ